MHADKFAIGEIVGVTAQSLTGPRTLDLFRILNRYMPRGKAPLYRIRSLWGRGERMVAEAELLPRYSTAMPRGKIQSVRTEGIQLGPNEKP